MNRKHIFFDCYQTLLDTGIDRERQKIDLLKGWETFVFSLGERHGVRISAERFMEVLERRKVGYYREHDDRVRHHDLQSMVSDALHVDFSVTIPESEVRELLYEYRRASRGFVLPYEGVREVLEGLSKRYDLSVASYTQSCFTLPELNELDLTPFFSRFIFSSDIGFRKTSADFYRECLRIVDAEASDCVMVGDNFHEDIVVPSGLGIRGVWIRNPETSREDHPMPDDRPVPTINLESFGSLPEVIDGMFSTGEHSDETYVR